MRAPRLSFSEEFRDTWNKENKDPRTLEFSPRTISDRIRNEIRKNYEGGQQERSKKIPAKNKQVKQTWLDELLGCK